MFGAFITNCIISTVVLSCICVFVYLCICVLLCSMVRWPSGPVNVCRCMRSTPKTDKSLHCLVRGTGMEMNNDNFALMER